jgi:hypothetical protein
MSRQGKSLIPEAGSGKLEAGSRKKIISIPKSLILPFEFQLKFEIMPMAACTEHCQDMESRIMVRP